MPTHAPSRGRLLCALVVLAVLTETAPLEISLIYPAGHAIGAEFGTAGADAVTASVSLAAVVSIPLLGRLADVIGKKRVLLGASAVFAVGALVSATAPNLPLLLLGRVLQGAVGGLLAVAYAYVREVFPARQVPLAIGAVATGIGVSGVSAPFLAGWLVDAYGYRGVFWFLFLLVLVASAVAAAVLPRDVGPQVAHSVRRLDIPGALLLGLAAAALVSGVGSAVRQGVVSPAFLGAVLLGVLLAVAFWRRERGRPDAAVDLALFRVPVLRQVLLASLLTSTLTATVGYLLPQLLQTPRHDGLGYAFGLSVLGAALWTFPQGLATFVAGPAGGLLSRDRSPRAVLLTAQVLLVAAAAALATIPGGRAEVMFLAALFGLGIGLSYVAGANLVTDAVPAERAATGTGLLAVANQLGAAIGASGVAALRTLEPVGGGNGSYAAAGYTTAFLTAAAAGTAALLITVAMRHGRGPASGGAPAHPAPPSLKESL
ncbi:MFS transporter [Streptomyces endophyticus]|uniref:MFS transporter n=1 Tax=Streptomyces endophyticus TaxID=714166 RepID=A0ABU6FJ71_9ACTN|nr:MFS transporter [Streptomyces endophyticus]MEB8344095.1 MFS transporter [Streptomyces endophyticus]